MSIITISRGSYSYGKETAEKLARELGYACISREILLEASEQFHVPEIRLVRAIHDSPSILDRFTHGREKYIAFIRSVLLDHMKENNIVYHGFAGHVFLENISHVLKIRIVADIGKRIEVVMKRDHVDEKKAMKILKKDDEERHKWGYRLYGIDSENVDLYDMVLHISTMTAADAADIIQQAVNRPCFQPTAESRKRLYDMALAAKVEAELVADFPAVFAEADDGTVNLVVRGPLSNAHTITRQIDDRLSKIDDIRDLHIKVDPVVMDVGFE